MKATIYTNEMNGKNEKTVKVQVNKYQTGFFTTAANGLKHQYEIILNGKVVCTMNAALRSVKRQAEKYMVEEFIYLNPLK